MYVKSTENDLFVSVSADNLNFLEDAKGKFNYLCLIMVHLTFSHSQLTPVLFSLPFTGINVFS